MTNQSIAGNNKCSLPSPRLLKGRETLGKDGKITMTRIPVSRNVVVGDDGLAHVGGFGGCGGHIVSSASDRAKLIEHYLAQAHARSKTILPHPVSKSQDRIKMANFIRSLARPIQMPPEVRRMHEQNGDPLPDPNVPFVIVGQPNEK